MTTTAIRTTTNRVTVAEMVVVVALVVGEINVHIITTVERLLIIKIYNN